MSEVPERGSPLIFATRQPPSATAIDEDIYLTVTAADFSSPGEVESVDIILSVEYARCVIAQLADAVSAATNNDARLRESGA